MFSKLEKIKEERTIEATKKDLMGIRGKLGTIVTVLGDPIRTHKENEFFDEDEEENDIPIMDLDMVSHKIGYIFSGLSRGYHLEIKLLFRYQEDPPHNKHILNLEYKGYNVFLEVGGELESYAPSQEWESIVEKLYQKAKDKDKETKKIEKKEKEKENKNIISKLLEELKSRWGIVPDS